MKFDEYFDLIIQGIIKQQRIYAETGVIPEFELDGHDPLEVSPDDSPELRRRIIIFKAKLAEWKAIGIKHNYAREHASLMCVENLTAIFGDL